jgi:glucoamylase
LDALTANQTTGISRQPVAAALVPSRAFASASAGFSGTTDGWQILHRHGGKLDEQYADAGPGNVALTGEITLAGDGVREAELALGFGSDPAAAADAARNSLRASFDTVSARYADGWKGYTRAHLPQGLPGGGLTGLSLRLLRMHMDKGRLGAMAAGLVIPAIPSGVRAPEANVGGYHLVWPRDLYHSAMALMAGGDSEAAVETLGYFARTQKDDGSWWQNTWVDGTPYWKGLQMDEVAFPILLAAQIQKRVRPLKANELSMVRRAADFIRGHGPTTGQDRWEEIGGYIPSTIAAEIAGLRAATKLLGDGGYDQTAESWSSQLEHWTFRHEGPMGRDYFLRVSPSGHPEQDESIWLANGSGQATAPQILDGGFLELVRLGVRGAQSPSIQSTLAVYEQPVLGVASPLLPQFGGAQAYHRYNRDGYGHENHGGFWPLLAGERGHYALAAGDLARARAQLELMKASQVGAGHLPEQLISPPQGQGQAQVGPGAPCPLAWSHGEYLLLSRSLNDGSVFDAP